MFTTTSAPNHTRSRVAPAGPAGLHRPARHRRVTVAREHGAGYDTAPQTDPATAPAPAAARTVAPTDPALVSAAASEGGGDGGDLRRAIRIAAGAMERVRSLAADRRVTGGGELAGLIELLATTDVAQAAVVELVDRVESGQLAERRAGLPLEGVLAMQSRATYGDRRFLHTVRDVLTHMPNLKAAFHDGALGWGQVRAVVAEAARLTVDLQAQLDGRFADRDELSRLDADMVVDQTRIVVDRLRQDLEAQRSVRRVERRYLHVQPDFDGGVRGNFALPPVEGALLVEALDAAAAPPTGDRDVTRDALDRTPDLDDDGDRNGPDGDDPLEARFDRPRSRQRADAVVRLAEAFLAGRRADGTRVRARPTMLVLTDINDLVGDSESARRARLLWRLPGAPPALTPQAVRRLASDADLQFLLTDGHQVLGISAPTAAIPARLRRAVRARDQGCRFPGCRAPAGWTDLHHVISREHGGPTTLDNLVAICRRHHTAVTEGRWHLDMTDDAIVTVRRGRHRATSDPPLRRHPFTA